MREKKPSTGKGETRLHDAARGEASNSNLSWGSTMKVFIFYSSDVSYFLHLPKNSLCFPGWIMFSYSISLEEFLT